MPIAGEQVKVEYRSRSNFNSITKDPNTLYFVEESNGKFTICVGNTKFNHLIAGTNITIDENTNVISASSDYYKKSEIDLMLGNIENVLDAILGV